MAAGTGTVIWCAPYDEMQQTYPSLPQSHGQDDQISIACVDFTLEFDLDGALTRVDLEGDDLAETLLQVGLDPERRTAEGLLGRPAKEVCTALPPLLAALLNRVSA